MQRNRYWIIFSFMLIHAACHGGHGHDHGATPTAAGTPPAGEIVLTEAEVKELGIRAEPVIERAVAPSVRTSGELAPLPGAEAVLKASARGLWLPAEPPATVGSVVRRGDLLGRIAAWTTEAQAELLSGEWDAAWTLWQSEKKRLDRSRKLFDKGLESRERLEEAETAAALARSRVNHTWSRIARLRRANAGHPDSTLLREVRAPIDGTLTRVLVGEGGIVEEGQELITVLDERHLELRIRVFDTDLGGIGARPTGWFTVTGDPAPLQLGGPGQEPLVVLPVVDPVTRTGTVLARLDNTGGRLRGGTRVRVHLRSGRDGKGPVVPRSALVRDGFSVIAFVRTGPGTFARRLVRTGDEDETGLRVLEGLAPGEEVVVENPQHLLYHSAKAAIPQSAHTH